MAQKTELFHGIQQMAGGFIRTVQAQEVFQFCRSRGKQRARTDTNAKGECATMYLQRIYL
jgi:hypothetical protein